MALAYNLSTKETEAGGSHKFEARLGCMSEKPCLKWQKFLVSISLVCFGLFVCLFALHGHTSGIFAVSFLHILLFDHPFLKIVFLT
jgi:hypothetical protein